MAKLARLAAAARSAARARKSSPAARPAPDRWCPRTWSARACRSSSLAWPFCTPSSPNDSARVSPRSVGSPASAPMTGAGAAEPLRHAREIGLRLEQQAVLRKERIAVELAHRDETGRAARPAFAPAWRWPRWRAPASAHRPPPGSSRTSRGIPSRRPSSRCRQSRFGRDQLVDVGRDGEVGRGVIAGARGDDRPPATTTAQAWRLHSPTICLTTEISMRDQCLCGRRVGRAATRFGDYRECHGIRSSRCNIPAVSLDMAMPKTVNNP